MPVHQTSTRRPAGRAPARDQASGPAAACWKQGGLHGFSRGAQAWAAAAAAASGASLPTPSQANCLCWAPEQLQHREAFCIPRLAHGRPVVVETVHGHVGGWDAPRIQPRTHRLGRAALAGARHAHNAHQPRAAAAVTIEAVSHQPGTRQTEASRQRGSGNEMLPCSWTDLPPAADASTRHVAPHRAAGLRSSSCLMTWSASRSHTCLCVQEAWMGWKSKVQDKLQAAASYIAAYHFSAGLGWVTIGLPTSSMLVAPLNRCAPAVAAAEGCTPAAAPQPGCRSRGRRSRLGGGRGAPRALSCVSASFVGGGSSRPHASPLCCSCTSRFQARPDAAAGPAAAGLAAGKGRLGGGAAQPVARLEPLGQGRMLVYDHPKLPA